VVRAWHGAVKTDKRLCNRPVPLPRRVAGSTPAGVRGFVHLSGRAAKGTVRVQLDRAEVADQGAQVDEVSLVCGALVELGALPSTDEVLRGEFGHGQLWVGKVEDFP